MGNISTILIFSIFKKSFNNEKLILPSEIIAIKGIKSPIDKLSKKPLIDSNPIINLIFFLTLGGKYLIQFSLH